jgi:hypothetical protein
MKKNPGNALNQFPGFPGVDTNSMSCDPQRGQARFFFLSSSGRYKISFARSA